LTQDFANDPLLFEPGTKFSYSRYGYIVLGCAMEAASGMSYAAYMQQSIFSPAAMTSTRLDDVFAINPHRARGQARAAIAKAVCHGRLVQSLNAYLRS
jgi:CubicO group peptidase (beta-lactamase class C family)